MFCDADKMINALSSPVGKGNVTRALKCFASHPAVLDAALKKILDAAVREAFRAAARQPKLTELACCGRDGSECKFSRVHLGAKAKHKTHEKEFMCIICDGMRMRHLDGNGIAGLASVLGDIEKMEEQQDGNWEIYKAAWNRVPYVIQHRLEAYWKAQENLAKSKLKVS